MTEVFDLDKEFGLDSDAQDIPIKEFKAFGRKWHILCDVNSFQATRLANGDTAGFTQFLVGMVVADEQEDFTAALGSAKNLNGEKLVGFINRMVEIASDRPTEPPSSSSPSAKNRASGRKSTVGSSSGRVVRSVG